jgi:hypothetical protein
MSRKNTHPGFIGASSWYQLAPNINISSALSIIGLAAKQLVIE